MNRRYGFAVVVAGFVIMLSLTPGWGQVPMTNDLSAGANTGGGDGALGALAYLGGGDFNTAYGYEALTTNFTGSFNTAFGSDALVRSTGDNNIAVGASSGINLVGGDNNIYLGSPGPAAPGSESNTMRVGRAEHRVFIPGIFGKPAAGGAAVYIKSNGKLGTLPSSARYKRDIKTMGPSSQHLLQLRPVTFTYKEDPEGGQQYGLIAEEVAKVYPELVTRTDTGEVEGVRYEALIPMLLNELQRQQQELQGVAELKAQLQRLKAQHEQELASLKAEVAQMRAQQVRAEVTHTASLDGR